MAVKSRGQIHINKNAHANNLSQNTHTSTATRICSDKTKTFMHRLFLSEFFPLRLLPLSIIQTLWRAD